MSQERTAGTTPRAAVAEGWGTVALLGAGAFAVGTDMFVTAGTLPALAADLGVPVGTAGLTVTAFELAYAAGAVSFGSVIGARAPRRVLVGSVALCGLLAAAAAVAPNFALLLAVRVLAGLAGSCFLPSAGALAAAAVRPEHRGRALGSVLAGCSVAVLLGAPAGVLVASWLSWRAAFWLVALLAGGVGLALASGLTPASATGPASATTLPDGRSAAPAPRAAGHRPAAVAIVPVLAVTALATTASNTVFTYLPALLPAAGPATLASCVVAFGLGGLLGSWWGGAASDRRGGRAVTRRALAALGATLAVLPLAGAGPAGAAVAGVLASALGWGTAGWALIPAQQHRLIGLDPASAPALLALNSAAVHGGFAVAALAGGLVLDAIGAAGLWLFALTCCGGALAVHHLLTTEERS